MKPGMKWYGVWAQLSEAENARVRELVALEGLSISDFVRRCINGYLVELDDDGLLLAEKREAKRAA